MVELAQNLAQLPEESNRCRLAFYGSWFNKPLTLFGVGDFGEEFSLFFHGQLSLYAKGIEGGRWYANRFELQKCDWLHLSQRVNYRMFERLHAYLNTAPGEYKHLDETVLPPLPIRSGFPALTVLWDRDPNWCWKSDNLQPLQQWP